MDIFNGGGIQLFEVSSYRVAKIQTTFPFRAKSLLLESRSVLPTASSTGEFGCDLRGNITYRRSALSPSPAIVYDIKIKCRYISHTWAAIDQNAKRLNEIRL